MSHRTCEKKLFFLISRNLNGLKTTIWFTYPLRIHSMLFFVEDECFAGWVTVAVFWSRNLYQFFDEFFFGTKIKQFQSLKYGTALHEVLLCTVANVVYHHDIIMRREYKTHQVFPRRSTNLILFLAIVNWLNYNLYRKHQNNFEP